VAKKRLSRKERKRLEHLKKSRKQEITEEPKIVKRTSRTKRKRNMFILFILIFLIIGYFGYIRFFGISRISYKPIKIDDPVIGLDNASVTIVEYTDFQCSYCAQFHSTTYQQIKDEFIDTGKVKFMFKDFPITQLYPFSEKAAEAANCAYEQDKFWEYHDMLYMKQAEWTRVGIPKMKDYAQQLGLNITSFDLCLDSGVMRAKVLNDLTEGRGAGVTGTPSFFINGRYISGAMPFSEFKRIIEEELVKT
jgi:protein-disulfide isomerase